MRKDDLIRIRHMLDAAREAISFISEVERRQRELKLSSQEIRLKNMAVGGSYASELEGPYCEHNRCASGEASDQRDQNSR